MAVGSCPPRLPQIRGCPTQAPYVVDNIVGKGWVSLAPVRVGTDGRKQEPVLIHGQSGSGKSFALARLAYAIRKQALYPVLLGSRAGRIPAVEELDDFCTEAEEAGAEATLVICDANAPASRYGNLLRGFTSRGRRVVIVGSAYRIVDESGGDPPQAAGHLLEVPAELDSTELSDLANLVATTTGVTLHAVGSKYLLPVIYRILPDVRPRPPG